MGQANPLDDIQLDQRGRLRRWSNGICQQETRANQRAFLQTFECVGRIGEAAAIQGISPGTHAKWIKTSPRYKRAFQAAKARWVESLEREAYRRAVDGVDRLKFFKGFPIMDPRTNQPYTEKEYSDRLLVKLLEANAPEKYRSVSSNSRPAEAAPVSVNVGVGVQINNAIQVIQNDDWYGNAHRFVAASDGSHTESLDE